MSRGIWNEHDFAKLPSLSVAAHELKSPITLMRQLALAIQSGELSPDEERKFSDRLVMMSDRSLQLVNDLSHVGNLQPSLFPLEPTNPLAVCRRLHVGISPMAEMYGRDIIWPKNRRVDLVSANSQLLGSVLGNFIDNALKYSQENMPIRVKIIQKDGATRMVVRDHGPQISLKEYRRLVDEMEQLKSIKTRPDSSGLGVYIASQFARAMGAEIGLIRHRDGVSFYIDLVKSGQLSWL